MSYIAVNLHEVKQDRVRIKLAEPLYGKDGETQAGSFWDVDLKKLVKDYTIPATGIYQVDWVMIGKNIEKAEFVESDQPLISLDRTLMFKDAGVRFWYRSTSYLPEARTKAIQKLTGLAPDTVIEHCYFSYQRIA